MTRLLVVYGTSDGHTKRIAQRLAEVLVQHGAGVDCYETSEVPARLDVGAYDVCVLGASLHFGKYQRGLARFVRRNRDALARKRCAFFSVSLSAVREGHAGRDEVAGCMERLFTEVDWWPKRVASFAGALLYTHYGWLRRRLMRSMSRTLRGDLDTSRDYDYTDWDEVQRFALECLELASPRDRLWSAAR